jgi:hypothetical protein
VREAAAPFHDATLASRVGEAYYTWRLEAQAILDASLDEDVRAAIREQAADRLAALTEQVEAVRDALRVDASGILFPEPVIPEPEDLAEPDGLPLVHSGQSYTEASLALCARKSYQP